MVQQRRIGRLIEQRGQQTVEIGARGVLGIGLAVRRRLGGKLNRLEIAHIVMHPFRLSLL